MIAIFKICVVVTFFVGFLVTIRVLGKKFDLHPEWQRKLLHVGFGLTSLCFPWIFSETWEVFAVCASATFILLLIRAIPSLRNSIGKSLHSVKRFSVGELLLALSIVLIFWFSDGNTALYVIPLTILTISDAVAALVGTHYGKKLFTVIGGIKSWEGTLAFAGITFLILLVLLYAFTPLSWPALFMIALTFSALGALIEAVSWHGLDNLFVPLAAYLFLDTFLHQNDLQLFYQLCVLAGLVLVGLSTGPKSQLNTHALMTATISLYFFWVVGNMAWLMAPVLVFFCHITLVKFHKDEGNYTMSAVLSVISGGFFWLLIEHLFHIPFGFFLFTLALAIHLQIIVLLRLKTHRGGVAKPPGVMLTSILSGGIILSTALIYYGINIQILVLSAFGLLVMFIGGVSISVQSDRFSKERWVTEAVLALVGSASAFIPMYFMMPIYFSVRTYLSY